MSKCGDIISDIISTPFLKNDLLFHCNFSFFLFREINWSLLHKIVHTSLKCQKQVY